MDIEILKKKLGSRLRELRLAKGLRQEDLEKWDFSYRYYGKLERGLTNPTLDTLVRLCNIFDVSLEDLFLFLDKDKNVSDKNASITFKLAEIIKENNNEKIKKLSVFLDEIL